MYKKSCRWLTAFRTTQALAESLRSKVLVCIGKGPITPVLPYPISWLADGPARDPGGRPSGRISNDIISVASEHNQQSIILHTSIELFAELAITSVANLVIRIERLRYGLVL
jgi:hypothetical protein